MDCFCVPEPKRLHPSKSEPICLPQNGINLDEESSLKMQQKRNKGELVELHEEELLHDSSSNLSSTEGAISCSASADDCHPSNAASSSSSSHGRSSPLKVDVLHPDAATLRQQRHIEHLILLEKERKRSRPESKKRRSGGRQTMLGSSIDGVMELQPEEKKSKAKTQCTIKSFFGSSSKKEL